MEPDYKYQAEYAKSNRSTCRACKNTIGLGSLRMGALVQSHIFDGKMTLWYHYNCFFKRTKVLQTSDIKNFEKLKFEDQEKIIAEIKSEKFLISNYKLKENSDDGNKCTNCSKIIKVHFRINFIFSISRILFILMAKPANLEHRIMWNVSWRNFPKQMYLSMFFSSAFDSVICLELVVSQNSKPRRSLIFWTLFHLLKRKLMHQSTCLQMRNSTKSNNLFIS